MNIGTLGKMYNSGDLIFREGEKGDCMFVIQSGEVEIVKECDGKQIPIAVRSNGDFFGEEALFVRDVREASVRARGNVQVLTIDKRNLLRRLQDDPSLAFRVIETLSQRLRELSDGVTFLAAVDPHRNQK
jgi:CRP/FNR family cyclic AMP-dependent transcriptional regulator